MPRLCPEGRTPEFAIVRSARISFNSGIKDPATDEKLLRYLYKNKHTSPFESVKFTFHIRCPKFVSIQLIRHRTANVNEFSQRYAKIKDNAFYHPSAVPNGIRLGSTTNKQGSTVLQDEEKLHNLQEEIKRAEALCDEMFATYQKLVNLGLAKEIARFCLPGAAYTELYFTMDLHNLLNFLRLRMDKTHAQLETVVIADAICELITPLVPTVMAAYHDYTLDSITLSAKEIEALCNKKPLESESRSDQEEFKEKLSRLGL